MNKQQSASYAAIHRAVESGRLEKPDRCEICGIDCEHQRIEAHHHAGHENRFDVWWLCHLCNTRLIGDGFHDGSYTVDEARKYLKDNYGSYHGYCIKCNILTSPFYQNGALVRYLG